MLNANHIDIIHNSIAGLLFEKIREIRWMQVDCFGNLTQRKRLLVMLLNVLNGHTDRRGDFHLRMEKVFHSVIGDSSRTAAYQQVLKGIRQLFQT